MKTDDAKRYVDELNELRERLLESEENLEAIRRGEVDAIVVSTPEGNQIYTLESGDLPYRKMIEDLDEGVTTLSDDFTILYCNNSFAEIIGAPLDTIIGSNILEYCVSRNIESFTKFLEEAISGHQGSGEYILRSKLLEEVPVYALVNKIPVKGSASIYVIFSNLTERETLSRRAFEAERMASLGNFTAKIAIDLKGPLNIISQAVEVMKTNPDMAQRMLEMIESNSSRALGMVEEVRSSVSEVILLLEHVDLEELISSAINKIAVPTQVTIELDLVPNMVARVDQGKLSRVIVNLVQNSIDVMPLGGVIKVSTLEENGYQLIRVTDTGPGISSGVVGHIFEPFISDKPNGLGLSLSYSKRVMDGHGGSIGFSTSPGKGTTFTITLQPPKLLREYPD